MLFIPLYYFVTATAVEPYYLTGLIYLIPFISFVFITYLNYLGKLKKTATNVISTLLIFILGSLMLVVFVAMAIDAAVTDTTNISKYERVLRINNYPENELIKYFPPSIPEDAKDVKFRYSPAFMQGGEMHQLMFETDSEAINNYINKFSKEAIWIGKFEEALKTDYAIHNYTFSYFGYNPLPDDFNIYLFASDNTNHGEVSLAAISKTKNTIIFIADNW